MTRFLLIALIWMIVAKPAFAAVDLATGSLIVQGILAGLFTYMMMRKKWRERLDAYRTKKAAKRK
ncbi:MAG: hypothetical protein DI551_12010 [Micavibrio aeruginosavorus]|uniref:Uncharacterized protein n=1 Tax=Micavibrio aeruginosavorus TaxID=349221 RepID=A0A2W5MRY1_9BACT|nr:MAG: hypothetical protein DI551_12010 [Micavibrio aeruginosavorus]